VKIVWTNIIALLSVGAAAGYVADEQADKGIVAALIALVFVMLDEK
jgi:hypothetical protein